MTIDDIKFAREIDALKLSGKTWAQISERLGEGITPIKKRYYKIKKMLDEPIPESKGHPDKAKKRRTFNPDICHYKVCHGCHFYKNVGSLGRVCLFTAEAGIVHRVRVCQEAGRINHPPVDKVITEKWGT